MSAVLRDPGDARRLRPASAAAIGAMLAIENACYDFPWTRGNFVDSLAAGYLMQCLYDGPRPLVGYFVAMRGVGEMHLLNITVAPAQQHRGHARFMLDALARHGAASGARKLWLEVRAGNRRAQALYRRYGFEQVGVRRGYYPAPHDAREDALVMSLDIGPDDADGRRALD